MFENSVFLKLIREKYSSWQRKQNNKTKKQKQNKTKQSRQKKKKFARITVINKYLHEGQLPRFLSNLQ
jgi:hypothetical protein